jgi:hypothetical protein
MKIGYGRVSTRDQNPDAQHDALAAAGCDQVFVDKASGKLARRPELERALLVARAGDEFVVTKLDRLGRSLEHLIDLSKGLQARSVDLVVLDQGIDTSTAIERMFFQRHCCIGRSWLAGDWFRGVVWLVFGVRWLPVPAGGDRRRSPLVPAVRAVLP